MLQDIRLGRFKPDDRRVQRIAEQTQSKEEFAFLSDDGGNASDSDDFEASDLDRNPMGLEPNRTAFDDLTLEAACNSMVHIHSGVLHVLTDGETHFVCGRKKTKNYKGIDESSLPTDIPVCIQCAKSLP